MRRLFKESVLAGVYGLALGDAVGVPFEFMTRDKVRKYDLSRMYEYGSHNQPMGTFSDDTSMVLATLDAMGDNIGCIGGVMDNFKEWLNNGIYTANGDVFDVGGTTLRSIQRYSNGEDLALCGECDEYSNGNGSLMRMLPMVYYIWVHRGLIIDEGDVNIINMFSSLTHAHDLSKMCCVYYVYVALYILAESSKLGIQKAIENGIEAVENYYTTQGTPNIVLDVAELSSLKDMFKVDERDIKSSGYVVDSLEASLWCLYHSKGYKNAVCSAVSLGEDTDTIGAITGSLAGLYYGLDNLPVDWMAELRNKALIDSVCNRFFERYK